MRLELIVESFDGFDADVVELLSVEADALGRFLRGSGRPAVRLTGSRGAYHGRVSGQREPRGEEATSRPRIAVWSDYI
jgi:hypothetical protein